MTTVTGIVVCVSNDFTLGATRLVQVALDVWVASMVGQRGIKTGSAGPPIRYDAVERCLVSLADQAQRLGVSVQMPRIGCGSPVAPGTGSNRSSCVPSARATSP